MNRIFTIFLLSVALVLASACQTPAPEESKNRFGGVTRTVVYHKGQQEYEHGIVETKIYYDRQNRRVMQEDILGEHHPLYMKDGTAKAVATFGKDGKIIEIKTYDKDGSHLEIIMP